MLQLSASLGRKFRTPDSTAQAEYVTSLEAKPLRYAANSSGPDFEDPTEEWNPASKPPMQAQLR